jgi:adenylosuccinate synthase
VEHDWVVRYQGGANAGHSVICDGRTVVLRLLPSGILRADKKCVIANGVVVDPEALVQELDELAALGVSAEGRLFVSDSAHLILPYHRLADRAREEGPNAVGTTKRGIGPAYEDKAARVGVRVGDLFDVDALAAGVREVRMHAVARVESESELPAVEEVVSHYRALGGRISHYVADTRSLLWDALDRGDRVLLEGAQGTLLDVDHGTYPYVTSSNAATGGALSGAGIGPRTVTRVVGVAKAYTTRVGLGPFPTELTGEMGSYIREAGDEYGAVTGRPRRCGWLDALALCYAVRLNGLDELMITKLDVFDGLEKIGIAVGYWFPGRESDRFVPRCRCSSMRNRSTSGTPGGKRRRERRAASATCRESRSDICGASRSSKRACESSLGRTRKGRNGGDRATDSGEGRLGSVTARHSVESRRRVRVGRSARMPGLFYSFYKERPMRRTLATLVAALSLLSAGVDARAADLLPSWNETAPKKAIVDFVARVTKESASDFVPPAERIATFDNDGTLWAEQPMYFQLLFVLDRIKVLAPQHPEWMTEEPFASVLEGDVKTALAGGEKGLLAMMAATHTGMTTEEFSKTVTDWLATAKHPKTGRPLTEMIYQPMLELLRYLRANGFKTYIVSGGGIEFMRPWTERVYGIPPEQVIGSYGKLALEMRDGTPVLRKQPEVGLIDDKEGKPVGIQTFIGRRPIAAFGNSDGDLQMLQWTAAGNGARFCMYVHHTDAEREWAYDRDSHIGRLDKGLDEAMSRGWTVVDMKRDWNVVFPPR